MENRHGGAVDISPGLIQCYFMIKYVNFSADKHFLYSNVFPYTKNLLRFIETRFTERKDGKMLIYPLN